MIKSISGTANWAKRVMMTALFAGTMTLGAGAANLNKQNSNTTTPTELVSKDAAEAMKANALSPQTTQTVTATHNLKLDKTLRKFQEKEEDKTYYDDIINTSYEDFGLYAGSAIIQNEIDVQSLYAFMTGDVKLMKNNINSKLGKEIENYGSDFTKALIRHEKEVTTWLAEKYVPYITTALKFDHKPTAEEVCKRLDKITTEIGFNRDDIIDYYVYCDGFVRNEIHEKKTPQTMADLAAFKMYMIDRLMMIKALTKSGVFSDKDTFITKDRSKDLSDYYFEWLKSTEPKGK